MCSVSFSFRVAEAHANMLTQHFRVTNCLSCCYELHNLPLFQWDDFTVILPLNTKPTSSQLASLSTTLETEVASLCPSKQSEICPCCPCLLTCFYVSLVVLDQPLLSGAVSQQPGDISGSYSCQETIHSLIPCETAN